jgi:integrase
VNRRLGRLRAFYNWAIKADYVLTSPFKKGAETVVELFGEAERERRLEPASGGHAGEQERLLAAGESASARVDHRGTRNGVAGRRAPQSAMAIRSGWDLNELHLPARKTKAFRRCDLPMSQRLRSVREMRRHDPVGHEYLPEAYVFGDVAGLRIRSVKTAWTGARARAGVSGLTFHDLRREAGSRLLEDGMAPH